MIFKDEPRDFKKQIDVVACYIERADKILLLKRQDSKNHGGKFGLPAGKVEPGEGLVDAAIREIYEETGLAIDKNNLSVIDTLFVRNDGYDFVYTSFMTKPDGGSDIYINNIEHQEYAWVTPVEALSMDLIHDLHECIQLHYKI